MRRQTQRAERVTTTLRIERGEHVPSEGETVVMERALSRTPTAVTVHRIKSRREHPNEAGVWLLDATVTLRDLTTAPQQTVVVEHDDGTADIHTNAPTLACIEHDDGTVSFVDSRGGLTRVCRHDWHVCWDARFRHCHKCGRDERVREVAQ